MPSEATPASRGPLRRSLAGLGWLYRQFVTRLAALIILGWVAAAVLLPALLPGATTSSGELNGLVPPGSHALAVKKEALKQFRPPVVGETSVVASDPEGLSPLARADAVAWALTFDRALLGGRPQPHSGPYISGALPVPVIRKNAVVTYLYTSDASAAETADLARHYAAHFRAFPGVRTYVTGLVPAQVAQQNLLQSELTPFFIVSLAAVALIVTVTFRSLLAAGVVLGVAAVGYIVSAPLIGTIARAAGFAMPQQMEPLVVALILGVVTDYSMLFFQDFRERLAKGLNHGAAARETLKREASVITIAGLTVSAGTAALLVANLGIFRAFGPALAIAVLVGLAVSITLTPAVMTVLGHRLFHPLASADKPRNVNTGGSRLAQLSARAASTPTLAAIALVIGVAALLAAASPALGLRLSVSFTSPLPNDNPVSRGATELAREGIGGVTGPTEILIEQPGVARQHAALARLQHEIDAMPGVTQTFGPADNPLPQRFDVVLSRNGDAARIVAIFASDPLGSRAIGQFDTLQRRLPKLARQAGLANAKVEVTGQTAFASELTHLTRSSLWLTLLVAVVAELLILALFLRALLTPIILLALGALTVLAALGLTTLVFQDFLGQGGITFYAPFAAAVLLFSLGSDYNIFSVGNIWRAAEGQPLREALRSALPRTSRAIRAAGITLATTMAMVALVPIASFRELAFTLAVGLLLDTLIVRPFLTPALLILMGRVAGWPGGRIRTSRKRGGDLVAAGAAPAAAVPAGSPTDRMR